MESGIWRRRFALKRLLYMGHCAISYCDGGSAGLHGPTVQLVDVREGYRAIGKCRIGLPDVRLSGITRWMSFALPTQPKVEPVMVMVCNDG